MELPDAKRFLNKCKRIDRVDRDTDYVEVKWNSENGDNLAIGYFGINHDDSEVLVKFLGEDYIFSDDDADELYTCDLRVH